MSPTRLFALLALVLLGCGHTPKEGEAIADVCVVANDEKVVSASGYLGYTSTTYCDHDGCPFFLNQSAADDGKAVSIRVSFHEGKEPRQVEILKRTNFGQGDVIFRDDDGATFALGDVIRVTGKASIKQVGETITCTMFRPTGVQKL